MNPKTMKTLVWTAIVIMLIGMTVMSPVAGFALSLLSTVCSAFPAFFGTRRVRFAGILIMVVSLLFAVATYPKYNAEMTAYRARAAKAPGASPAVTSESGRKSP
jgi:hypothetical protein